MYTKKWKWSFTHYYLTLESGALKKRLRLNMVAFDEITRIDNTVSFIVNLLQFVNVIIFHEKVTL